MTVSSRREFLKRLAIAGPGLLITACRRRPPQPVATEPAMAELGATIAPESSVTAVSPAPQATTFAAGEPWQPPTKPRITANGDFYTMKYHPTPPPEVDPARYRLIIEGEVEQVLSLSLEEIRARPATTEMRTLECISNPAGGKLIGNAQWTGASMAALLGEAGVRPAGGFLRLESLDGYHTGIPLDLAQDEHALLVYEMNGVTLPAKHGYPLRALWPGRYGQKQPKWLQRIVVQRQPHVGYWEGRGWNDEAIILPNSRIEAPPPRTVQRGDFYVAGIGFTTDVGLARVEVSLDDGRTWQAAQLLRGPSARVWSHWWLPVSDLAPGTYNVLARVTDRNGKSQTRRQRRTRLIGDVFPYGSSEMDRLVVQIGTATGDD